MNAVEIEEAVSALAAEPFEAAEFPYRFLAAFGNKETTIKRLRSGQSNASDVPGGVLQRNNIHLAVAPAGEVTATLKALRDSPKTGSARAKFILATDGAGVEAEDLISGEALACAYTDLARAFGFFLPLAGISTVKEIKNNPVDIKATGRLNKLYLELLRDNADWATAERRHQLNQFMARLIFCFFAEDTGIFRTDQFTATISQFTEAGHGTGPEQWGNTHEVLAELFRAMDTRPQDRAAAGIKSWADVFPYVNGGLFTHATECPRFSRVARAYLLRAGELDWREINPDIFGSMIQAVADDGERGELGMHYTSVPNILKVLNPLFLDGLREQLEAAGDNRRKLMNLRRRLAGIRVFDPACGSGNFLVIAYKQMRSVEAEVVRRLRDDQRRSVIPLSNFYGIEIKGFAAEIARLALLIAEFQADCVYLSQQEARAMVLPLHRTGQITVGNALRVDWLEVCPPVTKTVVAEHDLAGPTGRLALEENGSGEVEAETYICGNPPYVGDKKQTAAQKDDTGLVFGKITDRWRSFDYVDGFIYKGAQHLRQSGSGGVAFVTTNSVSQGMQVAQFWPLVLDAVEIRFAHLSFKWRNLASDNAGVSCVIIGLALSGAHAKALYDGDSVRNVSQISPYLTAGETVLVEGVPTPISQITPMALGNFAKDGGHLFLDGAEVQRLDEIATRFVRPIFGAQEFIKGVQRYCLWIPDDHAELAGRSEEVAKRYDRVAAYRNLSTKAETAAWSGRPHRFVEIRSRDYANVILVPRVSSEEREYLPTGLLPPGAIVTEAFALYDAPLWNMALIASRLHLVWIATVCGKLETRYRYSNTLGWNTFPVPRLTEADKADLTRCAENILLAREAHFPATIADLYDPEAMPPDLRTAHEANDETLERIYIGRRFRNDTERLEKLFEMYSAMTAAGVGKEKKKNGSREGAKARRKREEAPQA